MRIKTNTKFIVLFVSAILVLLIQCDRVKDPTIEGKLGAYMTRPQINDQGLVSTSKYYIKNWSGNISLILSIETELVGIEKENENISLLLGHTYRAHGEIKDEQMVVKKLEYVAPPPNKH